MMLLIAEVLDSLGLTDQATQVREFSPAYLLGGLLILGWIYMMAWAMGGDAG